MPGQMAEVCLLLLIPAGHWTLLYNNLGLNDRRVLSLAYNDQFIFAGTAGTNYTMPDTGVAFFTPRHQGTTWTVNNTGLSRNGAHLEATTAMAANDTVAYIGTDDVGYTGPRTMDNHGIKSAARK
jgi:hypothetical protein